MEVIIGNIIGRKKEVKRYAQDYTKSFVLL